MGIGNDETLPIENKPKHPKKGGEIQGTKTHVQEDK
jgi:hypothetical protein